MKTGEAWQRQCDSPPRAKPLAMINRSENVSLFINNFLIGPSMSLSLTHDVHSIPDFGVKTFVGGVKEFNLFL